MVFRFTRLVLLVVVYEHGGLSTRRGVLEIAAAVHERGWGAVSVEAGKHGPWLCSGESVVAGNGGCSKELWQCGNRHDTHVHSRISAAGGQAARCTHVTRPRHASVGVPRLTFRRATRARAIKYEDRVGTSVLWLRHISRKMIAVGIAKKGTHNLGLAPDKSQGWAVSSAGVPTAQTQVEEAVPLPAPPRSGEPQSASGRWRSPCDVSSPCCLRCERGALVSRRG